MKITDKIELTNEDNMQLMARYPDKYFELAIIDIPYGINADVKNSTNKLQSKKSATKSKSYGIQQWDSEVPTIDFFNELFRVSKKQIIWGGNYVGLKGGYLFWNKNVTMPTYSQGELAWISWQNKIDCLDLTWHGMLQHDMKNKETRIHPTQKPVALYKWILDKYAKQGDKILDTHLGSASSVIAAHDYGFELVGAELDKEYYEKGIQRVKNHIAQTKLF